MGNRNTDSRMHAAVAGPHDGREPRHAGRLPKVNRNRIGTLTWGAHTAGRMGTADRIAMTVQAVRVILAARLARRDGRPTLDVNALRDVTIPASAMARRAEALCIQHSTPWLVQHCIRSYYWGALLALRDDVRYDSELFYVASLLHDLGLTAAAAPAPGNCFAISGAEAAFDALRDAEWPADRSRRVAEAIAMHLNAHVGVADGVEAYLLRAGSGLDVAGMRHRELGEELRRAVVDRHPRHDFTAQMTRTVRQQAERCPRTRIAYLYAHADFVNRIHRAPFDD